MEKINIYKNKLINKSVLRLENEKPEDEKINNKWIVSLLCLLIFSPAYLPIIFYLFNIGNNSFISVLLGIILGFLLIMTFITCRKIIIIKKFYKIKNGHLNCNIIKITDIEKVKELENNSALTFFLPLNNNTLNFIYNWLNNENVLKENKLNVYVFNGKLIKKAFNFFNDDDKNIYICVDLKDLNLTNQEKLMHFSKNHFYVHSRYLDDIIDNSKSRRKK